MDCGAAGEKLPAPHNDIDISGVELETVADAACHVISAAIKLVPEPRNG